MQPGMPGCLDACQDWKVLGDCSFQDWKASGDCSCKLARSSSGRGRRIDIYIYIPYWLFPIGHSLLDMLWIVMVHAGNPSHRAWRRWISASPQNLVEPARHLWWKYSGRMQARQGNRQYIYIYILHIYIYIIHP